jgi:lysophospholipase L1-like esterase
MMHDRICTLVNQLESEGALSIAGIGDSLTSGWAVRRGFFDRFCDVLEHRHVGSVISRHNAGVPGDTVSGGVARISALLARDPDVIIIQFGLNDMRSDEPVAAFEHSLSQLARAALQFSVLPMLATSCPLPDEALAASVAPYYEAIRRSAFACRVPLADLEEHWVSQHGRPAPGCPLFLADGVHPNDEGHGILAQGLLACFSKDTWISPDPASI